MIYYIDSNNGNNSNSGTDQRHPWKDISEKQFFPGDTVLFRRGCVWKQALFLSSGSEDNPITYGAYGDGEDPVINPSLDAGSEKLWKEISSGIWQYTGSLNSEVCNIVLNDGEAFGNLRWSLEELRHPGEWYYTMLGRSIHSNPDELWRWGTGTLYFACEQNPAKAYRSIELVTWGNRLAMTAQQYVVIEHFIIEKSGVHGFSVCQGHHIQIRNCHFRFIGGGVFDFAAKVRLGNGVEFWNGAYDCCVEDCVFEDIYDSGVTHQGRLGKSWIPKRLYFRRNLFMRCGMACYEWRGPSSQDIYFENNICLQGGGAFTMQGEAPPRKTEITFRPATSVYVLIWLIEQKIPEDQIYCTIRGNLFYYAPSDGAAISSGISAQDFKQFRLEGNTYCQPNGTLLVHVEGADYMAEEFSDYQQETGQDLNSRIQTTSIFSPPYLTK